MTSTGLERELKWHLEPAGHQALGRELARSLGHPRTLEQHNRFFDSADGRLRAARASLRLRLENQRLLLTCKRFVAAGGGLHQHREDEAWLPTSLWPLSVVDGTDLAHCLPLPNDIHRTLRGARLELIGGFGNRRLEWHRAAELIALDRTDFGARVDHELEVETPDAEASRNWWQEQLAAWGIQAEPQLETKLHRFIALAGR